jgi:hypothetical protein
MKTFGKIMILLICLLIMFFPLWFCIVHSWWYCPMFFFSIPIGSVILAICVEVWGDDVPEMEDHKM